MHQLRLCKLLACSIASSRWPAPIWECFRRYDTAGARLLLSLPLPRVASWKFLVERRLGRCCEAWRARSPSKGPLRDLDDLAFDVVSAYEVDDAAEVSCNLCFRRFPSMSSLQRHCSFHHSQEAVNFLCPALLQGGWHLFEKTTRNRNLFIEWHRSAVQGKV